MIIIPDTHFKAGDIQLAQVLNSTTKVNMLPFVTYCDDTKGEWHMLMPKALRESLATSLPFFLDCAMKGVKAPSAKELRMMAAMRDFFGK